jgi:hypothetical protein
VSPPLRLARCQPLPPFVKLIGLTRERCWRALSFALLQFVFFGRLLAAVRYDFVLNSLAFV